MQEIVIFQKNGKKKIKAILLNKKDLLQEHARNL